MSTIYDGAGNPFVQTDFKGNASCHFYDTKRNLETTRLEGLTAASCGGYDTIGVTMPNGSRKISTTWHPEWRLETRLAEPLKITTWVYNGQPDPTANNALTSCAPINALFADGKPIAVLCKKIEQSTTDSTGTLAFNAVLTGDSRVSTYSYSSLGQLLTVNGPRTDVADTTTFSYYAANASCTGGHFGCRGQLSKITNALGQITQITTYNANGQPTTIIRPNGTTTTLTYDARQRLTSRSWGSERMQYTYDAAGQQTNIARPDGSVLTYSYDNAHRLIGIKDQLGNRITYTLDNMGNRVKQDVYDPSNNLTQTHRQEVDALNRLYKDIGANNQTTVFKHDSMDNLTDATDPLNHTTSHNYDSLNRLIQNIDAAGATSN
jgi:YD repeat-containing protein